MSLNYGFGRDDDDAATKTVWERKFEALSEEEKKFFHEVLPYALMLADIGVVSFETIPHILSRVQFLSDNFWRGAIPVKYLSVKEEYLKKFIGFRANVRTTSFVEFKKKISELLRRDVRKLTEQQAKDTDMGVRDLILDDIRDEELPLFINHRWYSPEVKAKYNARLAGIKQEALNV